MRAFKPRPGTKSAVRILNTPLPDIGTFSGIVQSLVLKNPLGCTSYHTVRKTHPPMSRVRERYTARFVYEDANQKQIGASSEVYDSGEGYQYGIHAVLSNMANIAAHRGRVRHVPEADRFSVILKCHDLSGELYFVSLARDRITVSSYTSDDILKKVESWAEGVPALR